MAANVRYTGDPQTAQKGRVFTLPLSPTNLSNVLRSEGLGEHVEPDELDEIFL